MCLQAGPPSGNPPFTWEESAADAMAFHELTQVTDWSIERLAYEFERYNGFGYRQYHPHVKSPYLWSFSNHYTQGKYVADGRWSETAVSQQCGAMVLVKRLQETGHIQLALGHSPRACLARLGGRQTRSCPTPKRTALQRFRGRSKRN